jgi:hypothetical protein
MNHYGQDSLRSWRRLCNLREMPVTLDDVMNKLNEIGLRQLQHGSLLAALVQGEQLMSSQLDTLTAEVTQVETVDQSAIVLIKGLADQIAALKNDPAAIQALSDRLKASSEALAAAVTANTPTPTQP